MLFKKLFRLLVVSGAMTGATVASGCAAQAQTQQPSAKDSADAGTPADAGAKADQGGGSQGW